MRSLIGLLAIFTCACTSGNGSVALLECGSDHVCPEGRAVMECIGLADCNAGKTCGLVVPCIDGACVSEQKRELSCEGVVCSSDFGCPVGLHCRFESSADDIGQCALDGTCINASECRQLPPAEPCRGFYECQAGLCVYECQDFTCQTDSDCVLAFEDCCGCLDGFDGYFAMLAGDLEYWLSRPECEDVCCGAPCGYWPESGPEICWDDRCARAVCEQTSSGRECLVVFDDPMACEADVDCLKVERACNSCDCHAGYQELAVSAPYVEAYEFYLDYLCELEGPCEIGPGGGDVCTQLPAICEENQCLVSERVCDCPELWDPVCVSQDLLPVTFANTCLADCQQLDWYHRGECLEGEGAACGGVEGVACASEDLYCTCPGLECDHPAGGICLALGFCSHADDCYYQALDHYACTGSWLCPNHMCEWICD